MSKTRTSALKVTAKISKEFDRYSKDKVFLEKAGKIITDNIKSDSKLGKSYTGDKFPPLEKSTKEYKKYLAPFNTLGDLYGPRKSNITFTGQLIKSIIYKVKANTIEIFSKENRQPYKGPNGAFKNTATNPEILGHLKKRGWDILGVSKSSKKQIVSKFKELLRRKMR